MLAICGIGRLSTWLAGARCGIEPVVSLRVELSEPKISEKRPESLLQLAAPRPINEMATTCGQTADLRNTHMVTHSSRNSTSERINNVAVNRPLSVGTSF